MNYIFISPHFPDNYKYFVIKLAQQGARVLGIGSEAYDNLDGELKNSLTEYYKVQDMEDYDQVLRACGYFTSKYGKIDRIESHNEHWLEQDAKLRSDFNVFGLKDQDMKVIKFKSEMKKVFKKAGVPVAVGRVVKDIKSAQTLIRKVGYPVVAKPDNGVGAAHTYKIKDKKELEDFFKNKPDTDYIMEEFVQGEIHSFDGLTDKEGEVIFLNSFVFSSGIMEIVNEDLNIFYHSQREIPKDLKEMGLKALKKFNLKERFFHLEFFRTNDGRLIALEINVRPPGGLSMDIFNYQNDADLYEEYARLVMGLKTELPQAPSYYCGYVGIKKPADIEKISQTYGDMLVYKGAIAPVFSKALGNYGFIFRHKELEPIVEAYKYIVEG